MKSIIRQVASRPLLRQQLRALSTDSGATKIAQEMYKNLPAPELPQPPTFANVQEERKHKKERLAAAFRLFSKFGFDEGVAGHITLRDPEFKDTFWVNPFGMHFSRIRASDLIRVDEHGKVVEGTKPVNAAAFAIHSNVHKARPDVEAAAHSHSPAGRAFSSLGVPLEPINQDVLAFYEDLAYYDDYGGIAFEDDEGKRIARAIGTRKAGILRNHGLITVGKSVDEAVWWYIALERSCQVQMQAMAAANGKELQKVPSESAKQASSILGNSYTGWFQFQALYERILFETKGDFKE